MKNFFSPQVMLIGLLAFFFAPSAHATQHIWQVTSPDHGQTYAYGSETDRVWKMVGPDKHLALYATFDNEPWAQGGARRYDYFTFNFPQVKLGPGGNTFFYHTPNGLSLVVARKKTGLFGIPEITLLPTAYLKIQKLHGYLTLTLVIGDAPFERNPDVQISFEH